MDSSSRGNREGNGESAPPAALWGPAVGAQHAQARSYSDHALCEKINKKHAHIVFDALAVALVNSAQLIDNVGEATNPIAALKNSDGNRIRAHYAFGRQQNVAAANFIMFQAHAAQ